MSQHRTGRAAALSLAPTRLLKEMGVSLWLDGLSRPQIDGGNLAQLILARDIAGVTMNVSNIARAVAGTDNYTRQLASLAERNFSIADAVTEILTTDVIAAADVLHKEWTRTRGFDGYASIHVDPAFARDPAAIVARAQALRDKINRPNVMIEIPATDEGLAAITSATAVGINVNATLLFSIERYRQVIRAYLRGLEQAEQAGLDISSVHSVASFSVSAVDTEVDERLGLLDTPDADELRGTVGVANARLAYRAYQQEFAGASARRLLAAGANAQRPLWTSTLVTDPELRDTFYVEELIVPGTACALAEATLDAVADHGVIARDTITGHYSDAAEAVIGLKGAGVSYSAMTRALERDGIRQSIAAWRDLCDRIETAM